MSKIRITPINEAQGWFNICEDAAANDIMDSDLSADDVIMELVSGRTYTKWKVVVGGDNYVIQIH